MQLMTNATDVTNATDATDATSEVVENTVSDSQEPAQTGNEMSQNEVEKESYKISLKDKVIGYYQDLVASFSNLLSFLK